MDRAALEAETVARLGGWLAAAGLDATTVDGNTDLAGPIGWAIRQMGGSVSEGGPVDADLVGLADTQLADLTEYRTLLNIYQNYRKVDVSSPAGGAKLDQLRQAMLTRINQLRALLTTVYEIDAPSALALSTSSSAPIVVGW